MLVYTTGVDQGVHGFTLDPSIGEFLLSHRDIRIPDPPAPIYSVNEAYYGRWSPGQQRLMDHFRGTGGGGDAERGRDAERSGGDDRGGGDDRDGDAAGIAPGGYKSRYIGSLVSDFHRTLLQGGLFMYPRDANSPSGKLRILYEAAPLAMVCRAAGGRASDGARDILDIEPEGLHDRTPLYIGSGSLVGLAEGYLGDGGRSAREEG